MISAYSFMTTTTIQKQGEELNQLSRLLFNKAAGKWYSGITVEIFAGILGIAIGIFNPTRDLRLILTISGFVLLAVRYGLRLWFENIYDRAETMRRQSVLTETLNWPISPSQFGEWRLKAGKKILDAFQLKSRDSDYYATQEQAGSKRLLGVTLESAFWTRSLYTKISYWVWGLFLLFSFATVLIISSASLEIIPQGIQSAIVYVIYLFLPILLSVDLLGWGLRLNKLIASIKEIECDLERLLQETDINEAKVMRLVSEYNCQVVQGFPIHNRLFTMWHDEIQRLWDRR